MTPFLARLLEILLNNATIQSDWEKSHIVSYLQRRRLNVSHKLQTHKLNLCGLQATGTSYTAAGCLGQVWDKNGYMRDSMDLDWDTLAKVKSSQCART